jgi:L-asparaginase / beta-aspartyl-peptidase
VHGGARNERPSEPLERLQAGCLEAAQAGAAVLAKGGSAADAVEVSTQVLEDDPHFNAGTGAELNSAGNVELDASWMEGEMLRAGGVACVTRLSNPIRLARAVAERTPHVLLVGLGAETLAEQLGFCSRPGIRARDGACAPELGESPRRQPHPVVWHRGCRGR